MLSVQIRGACGQAELTDCDVSLRLEYSEAINDAASLRAGYPTSGILGSKSANHRQLPKGIIAAPAEALVRRLTIFARSVVPSDPNQLLLLVGSVLLLICEQLRCYPIVAGYVPGVNVFLLGSYQDHFAQAFHSWLLFSYSVLILIVFSGAAGLFVCFRPGRHPIRRTLCFVLLPAFAGIAVICSRFAFIAQDLGLPRLSVFQSVPENVFRSLAAVWSLGPALHVSVLGFALILVFALRLAMGTSSLPLSLDRGAAERPGCDEKWSRIVVFIWIAISCIGVVAAVAGASLGAVYFMIEDVANLRLLPPIAPMAGALTTACVAVIAAWTVGKSRWTELRDFLRPPAMKFAVLGMIFPIAISLTPNLAAYSWCRIQWVSFDIGKFPAPDFASYFHFPNLNYFWYLIAAGFEEVIWRGYLQPRFVRRYGLIRGIFLLGIVWSAFHFLGDFHRTTEDYQVPLRFAGRLVLCISMSYVLGWLTLRSGSIWPAILVHGLNNVWAFSQAQLLNGYLGGVTVRVCWVLLALALFRFWPPSIPTGVSVDVPEIGTEPIGPLPQDG